MSENIIFGPVPSRRFGLSLGVDLSPSIKQCNFDCLYCELDKAKTVDSQSQVVPLVDVVWAIKEALKKHSNCDMITLTANGEPTLYPYLDELIDEVNKIKGDAKILILSNGANIYDKKIQQILSKIDIVKLSLDCVSKSCFKKLDRVDNSIQSERIVDGMVEFRKIHKKQLITETLFVKTLNDRPSEYMRIYEALQEIKPDRVDIGTIDRPPAYDVQPVSYDKLLEIANFFEGLPVTIAHRDKNCKEQTYDKNEILALLNRRPLTQDDIENLFDKASQKLLEKLVKNSEVELVDNSGVKFYKFIHN
jgi:wyosine [tRNA(Phe)-imidazoG37] synthetase (radical SAM superfamily)